MEDGGVRGVGREDSDEELWKGLFTDVAGM